MRFGIGMNTDHTLEEVGQQFSVTRERIRQIEAKALRKLKHPSRSAEAAELPGQLSGAPHRNTAKSPPKGGLFSLGASLGFVRRQAARRRFTSSVKAKQSCSASSEGSQRDICGNTVWW